jgi:hypothetical protein
MTEPTNRDWALENVRRPPARPRDVRSPSIPVGQRRALGSATTGITLDKYATPPHLVEALYAYAASSGGAERDSCITSQYPVCGFPRILLLGYSMNRGNALLCAPFIGTCVTRSRTCFCCRKSIRRRSVDVAIPRGSPVMGRCVMG